MSDADAEAVEQFIVPLIDAVASETGADGEVTAETKQTDALEQPPPSLVEDDEPQDPVSESAEDTNVEALLGTAAEIADEHDSKSAEESIGVHPENEVYNKSDVAPFYENVELDFTRGDDNDILEDDGGTFFTSVPGETDPESLEAETEAGDEVEQLDLDSAKAEVRRLRGILDDNGINAKTGKQLSSRKTLLQQRKVRVEVPTKKVELSLGLNQPMPPSNKPSSRVTSPRSRLAEPKQRATPPKATTWIHPHHGWAC